VQVKYNVELGQVINVTILDENTLTSDEVW
jgi:hypothetical protein